jgi:hypothetical protein
MASVTNVNMQQENNCGHCCNGLILHSRHCLRSILTRFTIWHTAGTHSCPSLVRLTPFITIDKWWPASATNMNMQQQNNSGPYSNGLFLNTGHKTHAQYRPAIPFNTLQAPIHVLLQSLWLHLWTHTCPSSVPLTPFMTCDKWRPLPQIWTCTTSKIFVGIAFLALFWKQAFLHDQYRPATPSDTLLVPIHDPSVLLTAFITSDKWWQARVTNINTQQ